MKVDRYTPDDPDLAKIIDGYYAIESDECIEIQTIPNGRIDAVIVLDGTLEWFFPGENCFKPLSVCSFYPATRNASKARVQNKFKCVNIKFYPHVLNIDGLWLQQTVRDVRCVNVVPKHGDLSDHLGSYYDQSHFIKSCRQLTGLSPRELFTCLAPQMSDVVVKIVSI